MKNKNKMKISFPVFGIGDAGGEKFLVRLAYGLLKRGHEVKIILPKGSYKCPYLSKDLLKDTFIEFKSNFPFRKIVLPWKVSFFTPPSDIICATAGLTAIPTIIASKIFRRGIPFYLVQNWDSSFYDKPKYWFYRLLINKTYKYFDNFITVAKWLDDKIYETTGKRTTVIHPGIDLNVFFPREIKKEQRIKTILCLGRKEKIKGLPDLIKAIELVYQKRKDIRLIIVGRRKIDINSDIPCEQRQATDDELAKLYSSGDVFVLPSWVEGCPAPPLEAMACGAPVVTTDCLGIREYAINGENSLVVPPRNPQAMANAIIRLLSDEGLRRKFAEEGPKTAAHFTWDKTTDKVERLFKDALNRNQE
jgi:glycosyltransferase involved in cell wall biosynthesis